jgi:hypothetical protein
MTDTTRAVLALIEETMQAAEGRERVGLPYEGFDECIRSPLKKKYTTGAYKKSGSR